jgi:hypothetical protein
MGYPEWAPTEIVDALNENMKIGGRRLESHDMWERLVTNAEMKSFWEWLGTQKTGLPLFSNGGLVGRINREVATFKHGRKLSNTSYRNEMLKITKLAKALSKEIAAFRRRAPGDLDPFPVSAFLTNSDIDRTTPIFREEFLVDCETYGVKRRMTQCLIDSNFPSIDKQLVELGRYAEEESKRQFYKLNLPRKVNDKNVFRTYFIKLVIDQFAFIHLDYSPSRIAVFCSVALEDPQIDLSMVQHHCDLDAEFKELIRTAKSQLTSDEDED